MTPLLPERTTFTCPFTHAGQNCTGFFEIKSYIERGCRVTTGYVLVFACFATKTTNEISTDCFLTTFARFISRRGFLVHIYSDKLTAFLGAANVLRKGQNIISPEAPHMGGLREAGVKSFKTYLRKVSNAQKYTFEEFSTKLARIKECLNSRPLNSMSDNPTNINPLTPDHFLVNYIVTPSA